MPASARTSQLQRRFEAMDHRHLTTILGGLLMLTAPMGAFFTFTANPQSSEVTLDTSIVLRCDVADGILIDGWLFDDTAGLPSGAVAANGTLAINGFQPSNAGTYRCIASNGTGSRQVSHQAKLSHFSQRTFTVQPANYTSYVLSTPSVRAPAGFDCEFASYQPNGVRPYMSWEVLLANGTIESYDPRQLRDPVERFFAFQLDHHGYLQIIDLLPVDNATQVRCVATNPRNPSEIVRSDWAILTMSDLPRPSNMPVFSTKSPPTVYPIPGMDMVLPCSKTTLNSSLSIVWRESNSTLNSNFFFWGFNIPLPPDFSIVGRTNLQILNPQAHIGSTFACVAYNLGGSQATSIASTVIVASSPPYAPPIYTDSFYSYRIQSGTTITLPLGLTTHFPATWWWNARPVSLGPKYTINPTDQNLIIYDTQPADSGVYQGGVHVAQGEQEIDLLATFELTVYPALNISCEDHINGAQLVVFCSFNSPIEAVQCSINQEPTYSCTFPLYLPPAVHVLSLTVTAVDIYNAVAALTIIPTILECDGAVNSDVIFINCQAAFAPTGYTLSQNGVILKYGSPPYTLSVLTLDPGVHKFLVTATNYVRSASTLVNITVPALTQCHTPNGTGVMCSSNIPLTGAQCIVDVGPAIPCTFPLDTSTLAPGTHNIRITNNVTSTSSATFTVQGLPPLAPVIDQLYVFDKSNAIFIRWTLNITLQRPVSSYSLQITSPTARNQTLTLTNTSHVLREGITQGHNYTFQVRAINAYGSGDYSNSRTLAVPRNQSYIPWWVWLIVALLLLLALLLCCLFCCCLCCCKKRKQDTYNVKDQEAEYKRDMETETNAQLQSPV